MLLEDKIQTLIKILENSTIDELEISTFWGNQKIRLRKNNSLNGGIHDTIIPTATVSNQDAAAPKVTEILIQEDQRIADIKPISESPATNVEGDESAESLLEVTAPLVGTFYISSKPDTPPFVKVGDLIQEGQIVCIIEAMKIFNEIESEVSGKVVNILVNDASPVEYGQALISIQPV